MNNFNNDLLGIKCLVFFQNPLPTSMWKRKRVKELYTYLSNVRFSRPYLAWCSTNHSCGDWLTDRWKVPKTIGHYGKAGNKCPMNWNTHSIFALAVGIDRHSSDPYAYPTRWGCHVSEIKFILGNWCTRYFLQLSWRFISTINPLRVILWHYEKLLGQLTEISLLRGLVQAVFQFTFFIIAAAMKFDKVTDFAGKVFCEWCVDLLECTGSVFLVIRREQVNI